jgi:hypothetical protein
MLFKILFLLLKYDDLKIRLLVLKFVFFKIILVYLNFDDTSLVIALAMTEKCAFVPFPRPNDKLPKKTHISPNFVIPAQAGIQKK